MNCCYNTYNEEANHAKTDAIKVASIESMSLFFITNKSKY